MKPVPFEVFSADPQLLNEPISPPWSVFYRAVEGLDLDDASQQVFRACAGRDGYEPRVYTEATAICGRRSEKTSTALKFALWKSIVGGFQSRPGFWKGIMRGGRGELLRVPIICQDMRIAHDTLRTAKSFLLNSPVLVNEIAEELATEIRLRNGLALTVYPCSVRAPRGLTVPVAICDELGFWQIETGSNPDREVLRALRPCMIQFGDARRLIKATTPWMRSGVVYEEFSQRAERPDLLVWNASTEFMTPRISREVLEQERVADPSYFEREYCARFVDDIEAFLPSTDIDAAVVSDRRELPPGDARYFGAIDAGSLSGRDRFTFGIAHREPANDGSTVVDLLRGWTRAPVSQVCDELAALVSSYKVQMVVADQFGFEFLRELMGQRGVVLKQLPFSARSKPEIFFALKLALSGGKIQLLDHRDSLRELRALESKRLSGGGYRIAAPRGSRDDYACALAMLVHHAKSGSGEPWVCIIRDRVSADSDFGWTRIF